MQKPDPITAFPRIWPDVAAVYAKSRPPEASALCEAFESVTGWELGYWPTQSKMFAVVDLAPFADGARVEREPAERLAASISAFCRALWQQIGRERGSLDGLAKDRNSREEVEFVENVGSEIASKLENSMDFALRYVGGIKATFWLLDAESRFLNFVAGVGLSVAEEKSLSPRLLVASPAEITALAGQAVVAMDPSEAEELDCPFGSESAVCLPVSTDNAILGAVWFEGGPRVEWEDRELELLEIVCGRMALEIAHGENQAQ